MNPDGIKERFDLYRKYFRTLLVKEFLNLPTKFQGRFIVLLENMLKDCRRVFEEGKNVKERLVVIQVTQVSSPDNKEEAYVVTGTSSDVEKEIRLKLPLAKPKPKIGSKLYHTVFSIDGTIWYSSKEELITGNQS